MNIFSPKNDVIFADPCSWQNSVNIFFEGSQTPKICFFFFQNLYKSISPTYETYPGDMFTQWYSISIQSALSSSKMHLNSDKKQNKKVVLTFKNANSIVFSILN